MTINVIEDSCVNAKENVWRYDFTDGSSVEVKEQFTSPPSYKKHSGEFTEDRISAIQNYSFLQVTE
jgi:hypothetical protein